MHMTGVRLVKNVDQYCSKKCHEKRVCSLLKTFQTNDIYRTTVPECNCEVLPKFCVFHTGFIGGRKTTFMQGKFPFEYILKDKKMFYIATFASSHADITQDVLMHNHPILMLHSDLEMQGLPIEMLRRHNVMKLKINLARQLP